MQVLHLLHFMKVLQDFPIKYKLLHNGVLLKYVLINVFNERCSEVLKCILVQNMLIVTSIKGNGCLFTDLSITIVQGVMSFTALHK